MPDRLVRSLLAEYKNLVCAASWTPKGLVEVFVLFFIHVGTRRVHLAGMSARPNAAWIAERGRAVVPILADSSGTAAKLLHDWDSKFTHEFDDILQAGGIEAKKVGPCKPNQNAYAERWVQSIQHECLDRFMVFGEDHLRHIVSQYVEHYNEERPHQARDNLPLGVRPAKVGEPPSRAGDITCHSRLGGLLKHYARAA
jgi:putative transposase